MKKLRISSILLVFAMLTMSMGFPYKSSGEMASAKSGSSTYTYAGFMSCSVQQPASTAQRMKPIMKEVTKTNESKSKLTCNLAGKSACLIVNLINESR